MLLLVIALSPAVAQGQDGEAAYKAPEDIQFRTRDIISEGTRMAAEVFTPEGFHDRLAGGTRVGPLRRVHALPPGYLRQASGPGWALVGDAGHWLDPISTHGMTAGLRDADLLSAALLAGGPDLPGYSAQRDRLSLPMLDLTDRIASFGWGLSEVRNLLRSMASAMADEVEALADLAPTA